VATEGGGREIDPEPLQLEKPSKDGWNYDLTIPFENDKNSYQTINAKLSEYVGWGSQLHLDFAWK
jgi:hypothetical protein